MTTRSTTILPSAISREPATNLNLNLNTGPLISNIKERIPFIATKGFLSRLARGEVKYIQKEGYIDIADILANPPICNKLLYIVPDTNADIVKSCILSCFQVCMSQMVRQHMDLFNLYQQAIVKPAKSKMPNVVTKSYTNILIVHKFDYTNVQTTLSVSGAANQELKRIAKNCDELSTITSVDKLDATELEKQSKKHMDDITQYLAAELSFSQLSLNKGILYKCVQIVKGGCIVRPLTRVIERFYESLWTQNMTYEVTKRECLSKILNLMAEQTDAAIFELEHFPFKFLSNFIHEFLSSRLITPSLVKEVPFKIDNKEVGGIIVMPSTSFSFLNTYKERVGLKEGLIESTKNIYFKPDDIFAHQTDKDRVEILYKDGINTKRITSDDIKTENILIGNEKEQTHTIIKLTEAGKHLLSKAEPAPNNLMGEQNEFVMAKVHFKKNVQYIEHMGKAYPIEILYHNIPEDSDSQWIMNSEINHMGVAIWGGLNKKSKMTESYAVCLENGAVASDKTLRIPHDLFTVKPVAVKTPGIDSSTYIFGANEALKVLINPTRFSCNQVLEAINVTAQRVNQLQGEQTQYIQSYFNEVNNACMNHRELYTKFMKSLTIDGQCTDKDTFNKLKRIEYKEFFDLYKNDDIEDESCSSKYSMVFRFIAGNIPWFSLGDEINAIRGNKLLSCIPTVDWSNVTNNISTIKQFIAETYSFKLSGEIFYKQLPDINRMSDAGINNYQLREIKNLMESHEYYEQWLHSNQTEWENINDVVDTTKHKDIITALKKIADVLIDAFLTLFQTACEHQLNYLFIRNNRSYTQWLVIANVVLPVLTNGKMRFMCEDDEQYVCVNTEKESSMENMILENKGNDHIKTYVLSCNVSRLATLSKFSTLHRMASIFMLFMYNTPYCIEQMVCKGIHTGFSIAYVKLENTLAEDIMLVHPSSMELILSTGEIDNSDITSDGSTIVALTCEMQYTPNTIGPVGLLAQCVFPKPSLMNNSTANDGSIKISSDFITRTYTDKIIALGDLYFDFNEQNKRIIEQTMKDVLSETLVPYSLTKTSKNEYMPIICPAIDLNEKVFPVLGMERCADFTEKGGKSAFHTFFFCDHPYQSKNPYMSNLFSEGPVRYMKDTLMIDKNVPIKTSSLARDPSTGKTTQQIEDMYNMVNEHATSLTSYEQAAFTNFEDQIKLRHSVTQIPCILPENKYFSYEHPHLRLGNAIPYTQYTADDATVKQFQDSRATCGGDLKLDGTPFGFIRRSPFTANRDINPRMVDEVKM